MIRQWCGGVARQALINILIYYVVRLLLNDVSDGPWGHPSMPPMPPMPPAIGPIVAGPLLCSWSYTIGCFRSKGLIDFALPIAPCQAISQLMLLSCPSDLFSTGGHSLSSLLDKRHVAVRIRIRIRCGCIALGGQGATY